MSNLEALIKISFPGHHIVSFLFLYLEMATTGCETAHNCHDKGIPLWYKKKCVLKIKLHHSFPYFCLFSHKVSVVNLEKFLLKQ